MKRLVFLNILVIVLMCGCSNNTSNLKKVDIVLDWIPNTNHTGIYVAKEFGFFEENGIDVNIICPPEDASVIMVASARSEFGVSSQGALSKAFDREYPMPIKAVAAIMQHNNVGIISKKEKGITSASMLEYKTYASYNGPMELAMLKYIVIKDFGDYNKINIAPNTVTDVVSALSTNVDAMLVYYNYEGIAAKLNGLDVNFISFKDTDSDLDYYAPVIISNEYFLENNYTLAKKFMHALKRGYEYAAKNPYESANVLIKYIPQADKKFIIESQKYTSCEYISDASGWGIIDKKRWNGFYRWLYDNRVIDRNIERDTNFTNDYLS